MERFDRKSGSARLKRIGRPIARGWGLVFTESARHVVYDWHAHRQHQLIYSLTGRMTVQGRGQKWYLPPQRAAWIPAGVEHLTELSRCEIVSIYFEPRFFKAEATEITLMTAPPLLRELLAYARSWCNPGQVDKRTVEAQRHLLQFLYGLLRQWLREPLRYTLPASDEPRMQRLANYVQANLEEASVDRAARSVGVSPRTLRRLCHRHFALSFERYLYQARMLEAMDRLLSTPASILEIGLAVGYTSPSAFAKAFTTYSGFTPSVMRRSGTEQSILRTW